MRCYKVSSGNTTIIAATQGDARKVREQVAEKEGVNKKVVDVEEIDVPLAKAELIAYLNNLIEETRAAGIDEGINNG